MLIALDRFIDAELAAYSGESRDFNAKSRTACESDTQPDPSTPDGLKEARANLPAPPTPSGPPAVELVIEWGRQQVPIRILTPESTSPRGVYLEIHGGGFYLGAAARGDARNRRRADALGVAVVSVDYRLAPEHPWPAAPGDCEAAALWLLDQAESRFGTTRLAIGGASAGATLAMTTLLRLRDRGLCGPFLGAALQFGTYDLSGQTPAGRCIADEFFIEAYAGHANDRTDPDISPLFGDLANLPPVLMVVGSLDVMLEDNLVMAARLAAAGGDIDVRIYPDSAHGFTSAPTAMARRAVDDVDSWLERRFRDTSARTPDEERPETSLNATTMPSGAPVSIAARR